jgi:glutathione peroxidase
MPICPLPVTAAAAYDLAMTTRTIAVALIAAAGLVVAGLGVKAAFAAPGTPPPFVQPPSTRPAAAGTGPLSFKVVDIDGKPVDLADYRGKVVMIVNVASKCGFTPQYAGLEKLYQADKDKGFVILGFPADNFHNQEPGTDAEIKAFCTGKYNVTFPMMSKVSVLGADKCPLYKFLTEPATAGPFAGEVGWNFTKFVIDRNGNLTARFPSKTTPADPKLTGAIDAALAAPVATAG